jgi:hypothetical protein
MNLNAFLLKNNIYKKYESKTISDIDFLGKINDYYDVNLYGTTKETRINHIKNANINKNNLFEFDENFAIQANNYNNNLSIYDYYYNKGVMNGMIVHPKQIKTLFPNIEILENNNIIYIKNHNEFSTLSKFVQNNIYNKNFDDFLDIVQIVKDNRNDEKRELSILFHAGYNDIATDIINKMIECNFNKKYTLYINFNCEENTITECVEKNKIIKYIEKNFNSYIITITPNFGNDITPSILIYEKFKNQIRDTILLKIHTKQDADWRKELTDLFLDNNLDKLINIIKNNKQINCLGSENFLLEFENDRYNKILIKKIFKNVNNNNNFFAGTIFLCRSEIFDNCIQKTKYVLRSSLLLPFYYDNYLFWSRSPVHTIERAFGIIAKENYRYNLGIIPYHKNKKICIYACHMKNQEQYSILKSNIEKIINHIDNIIIVYSTDIIIDIQKLYQNKKIIYHRVKNDGFDFAKYNYGLLKYNNLYDDAWYILINDSIYFSRKIDDLFYSLDYLNHKDFIGIIDSKEKMLHYQSFFWCMKKNIVQDFLKYYRTNITSLNDKDKLIQSLEVEFSNCLINKYDTMSFFRYGSFDDIEYKYGGLNPNFLLNLKDFICDTGYPILKLKLILCERLFINVLKSMQSGNIAFFEYDTYLEYNKDLPREWTFDECHKHFMEFGKNENRIFSKKLLMEQINFVDNIIKNLPFI